MKFWSQFHLTQVLTYFVVVFGFTIHFNSVPSMLSMAFFFLCALHQCYGVVIDLSN
jgi:hypothetical protein